MGAVATITATTFPKQSEKIGRRVKINFHYAEPELMGKIVRDDIEHPFRCIIKLDDGRYILDSECQYVLEAT